MKIPNRLLQTPVMFRRSLRGTVDESGKRVSGRPHGRLIGILFRGRNEANSIIEFALVAPILFAVVGGIWQFGIAYSNMVTLTYATTVGAQVLQTESSSGKTDPCKSVHDAIVSAAPNLVAANISVTISMDGNTPITGSSCSGKQTQLQSQAPVTVQTSYPYSVSIYGMSLMSGSMSTGKITESEY